MTHAIPASRTILFNRQRTRCRYRLMPLKYEGKIPIPTVLYAYGIHLATVKIQNLIVKTERRYIKFYMYNINAYFSCRYEKGTIYFDIDVGVQ